MKFERKFYRYFESNLVHRDGYTYEHFERRADPQWPDVFQCNFGGNCTARMALTGVWQKDQEDREYMLGTILKDNHRHARTYNEIIVSKDSLSFSGAIVQGGQQRRFMSISSNTTINLALKLTTSDKANYKVEPAYALLKPNQKLNVQVVRSGGQRALEMLAVTYAKAPVNEDDPEAVFDRLTNEDRLATISVRIHTTKFEYYTALLVFIFVVFSFSFFLSNFHL
ncbi:MSP (Major sperm protein) domain-containing protein [Ditylenchus destructor]|nr:MSP (Major sperm protein) domain-containing protein [Ditylenchus destructor]